MTHDDYWRAKPPGVTDEEWGRQLAEWQMGPLSGPVTKAEAVVFLVVTAVVALIAVMVKLCS